MAEHAEQLDCVGAMTDVSSERLDVEVWTMATRAIAMGAVTMMLCAAKNTVGDIGLVIGASGRGA